MVAITVSSVLSRTVLFTAVHTASVTASEGGEKVGQNFSASHCMVHFF